VPIKQFKDFPSDVAVEIIQQKDGVAHCAAISLAPVEISFKKVQLPKQSLTAMRQRAKEDKQAMVKIIEHLRESVCLRDSLIEVKRRLEKELQLQQVRSGMGLSGVLSYVKGYFPVEETEKLKNEAKARGWGIMVEDISEEDNVPTLIRNPKWISLIQPVFSVLEVIPGYRELDVSFLFLVFFSIFFGMIIGDAGYGMVYFLLAFIVQKKLGKKVKDNKPFLLLYVLSSCAMIWGLFTGTLFGQEWYINAGLKPFVPALNNTKFLQAFCFFLGAFHLSLAHSWRAVLKLPSFSALSDIGWLILLWAGFFLAKTLILGDSFPFFGKWLIIAGVTLVVFFTNPQKNILKTIGEGLATLALSLMNSFSDVVSYIRLFAVGLAGVAIADTVNTMGQGVGNLVVCAMIMFIGHAINIVLGPMSVLVHGIRLNVLEFSGHASVTWSGMSYNPLSEK
jgi:V/A-type H+-transporting ATPase subunit I